MKRSLSYRRLLGDAIRKVFPAQLFSQWSLRQGLSWTPQRLVWVALLIAWSAEQTLADRFEAAGELVQLLFPRWRLGTTFTGFCQALAHWSPRLQPLLAKRLRRQLAACAGPYWTREGWCAFAADGSRVECPRTAANEAELGCAGKKRTAPQLFLTSLWHMGTGLPWDYRIGPGTASERRHLEAMLTDLPAHSLLVADAGFSGYQLYQRILAAQQSFLLRVGANVQLLQKLGYAVREGPTTVYLWPEDHRDQPPLVLRLIELRQGKQRLYLLTNVLSVAALSVKSAQLLYELRWGVEVFYRSCKQTLAKRKMLSRTPAAAKEELAWAVLGIWLLGVLSVEQLIRRGNDPLVWSVALARKRLRQAMRRAVAGQRSVVSLLEQLGSAVQDGYQRHGSKKARNWPHKKREKPPGSPKIKVASKAEVRRAKRLREKKFAA